MQSQSYSRVVARSSAALTIEILLLLTFVVLVKGANRPQDRPQQAEIGLEIRLHNERKPPIRLAGRGNGMTLIPRASLKINDPIAAGDFTLLQVHADHESGGIRVSLSLIYNDLSDHEWWKHKDEKIAGSYLIHDGESVHSAELDQFGIEPFEMKAVDARPVLLKPGEGPRITNTPTLQVEKLERDFDSYRIWVKNKSDKNIVAYIISSGRGQVHVMGEGYGRSATVLQPGATSNVFRLSDPEIEVKGIAVLLVIFDDGTFEGDSKLATNYLAKSEGVRIQSPSVLRMIEQTLKVNDSDLRGAFDKLESDLWIIPEALNKAPAVEYLRARFPDQDEKSLSAMYKIFKGGLYDSRNIALESLGETGRTVKGLEERGQFASAVELIRQTLERLRETFGKITSPQ